MTHTPPADGPTPAAPATPQHVDTKHIPDKTAYTRGDVEKAVSDALAARGRDMPSIRNDVEQQVRAEYATQMAQLTADLEATQSQHSTVVEHLQVENQATLASLQAKIPVDKAHIWQDLCHKVETLPVLEARAQLRTCAELLHVPHATTHLPPQPTTTVRPQPTTVAQRIAQVF